MLLSEPFATHTRRCVCTAACNERRVSISGRPTDSHSKLHAQLQRTQLARKRVGSDNDVCCDDAADDSNVPGRDGNRADTLSDEKTSETRFGWHHSTRRSRLIVGHLRLALAVPFTICSALLRPQQRDPHSRLGRQKQPPRMAAPSENEGALVGTSVLSRACHSKQLGLGGNQSHCKCAQWKRLALDVVARW